MQQCKYGCGQEGIHQFKNGTFSCNSNTAKCPIIAKKVGRKRGCQVWNKGKKLHYDTWHKNKTYEELLGVEKAKELKNKISLGLKNTTRKSISPEIEQERRRKIRDAINKRYNDGWMPKAGKCKKIKYSSNIAGNITVDGTWELRVAIHLDKIGVKWERNKKRFQYTNLKGTISHYTPDFYVYEWQTYIEVKGYETELDRCKWSQFQEPLLIWKKKEIMELEGI